VLESLHIVRPQQLTRQENKQVMPIERGKVVTFHSSVRDEEGTELESSEGRDPAAYLHGRGNIVKGLESEMRGRAAGDQFRATIAPEHAYGMYDPGNVKRVPIKHLLKSGKLAVGRVVAVNTERGQVRGTVRKLGRFNADVDFNHPLAGKLLTFDVNVVEVRDATPDELAHGHAHGPGGAQH
jgi:FKBP-type peptidyl-prolyl cis-trans isomerase SlyD